MQFSESKFFEKAHSTGPPHIGLDGICCFTNNETDVKYRVEGSEVCDKE